MLTTGTDIKGQAGIWKPLKVINGRVAGSVRDYLWHISLFSRNARLFLTGSFLIGLTMATVQLLMNLYLKERGGTESYIGTFLSAGALGTAVIAIPAAIALVDVRQAVPLFRQGNQVLRQVLEPGSK